MKTTLEVISFIADFITVGGVLTAAFWGIIKKHENIIAFKINMFLHYLLKTAIIFIIIKFMLILFDLIYGLSLVLFKGYADEKFYWESGKEFFHLISYFVSVSVILPVAWSFCTLIWTSSFNCTIELINLFLPKNKLLIKEKPILEIVKAIYGSDENKIDVTQAVRQMIKDNKLILKVSNEIAGDPHLGVVKNLTVNYRIGQKNYQKLIYEGALLTLPE